MELKTGLQEDSIHFQEQIESKKSLFRLFSQEMIDSSLDHLDRNGIAPGDRLARFDIQAHNAEVREMWAAFNARKPYRAPVFFGANTRYFMFNAGANPAGVQFKEYFEDPDLMFDSQLRFQRWKQFNLLQDYELGLPEKWSVGIDFQNFYEAAFLGCPLEYFNGEVPDTLPIYRDEPEKVMEQGIRDPFSGINERALRYFEHFKQRAANETFLGRPIEVSPISIWSDGVFTGACNLFGPDTVCLMMIEEPDRLHTLMKFITATVIRCKKAWQKLHTKTLQEQGGFWYADDSVALISTEMYREFVLPYHREYCDAMAGELPRGIHLCGDSTRHFTTIRDELNVRQFDTGFPIDFGKMRSELGPEVILQGGPHVEMVLSSTPDCIRAEVKRIMETGVLDGGMFMLREGNNLAPGTPLENSEAMYHAGREFGALLL
jgi:uroporphyrinogen-III decarboxylase